MKNKILTFIIGVLVGAVIATAGFLIYSNNNTSSSNPGQMAGPGGQGGPSSSNSTGEPPSMPSGNIVPNDNGNGNTIGQ